MTSALLYFVLNKKDESMDAISSQYPFGTDKAAGLFVLITGHNPNIQHTHTKKSWY